MLGDRPLAQHQRVCEGTIREARAIKMATSRSRGQPIIGLFCRPPWRWGGMRGVKKANATMITSAMRGVFRSDSRTRAEFMGHVDHEQ
jgi:hypothetical protein